MRLSASADGHNFGTIIILEQLSGDRGRTELLGVCVRQFMLVLRAAEFIQKANSTLSTVGEELQLGFGQPEVGVFLRNL
jgi:hypothetical protein